MMQFLNDESPEVDTLSLQENGQEKRDMRSIPQGIASVNGQGDGPLSVRFLAFLEQYVHKLQIRGHKATGLCPFHLDRHPSFSANMEKGVWYCHACGKGGGVKAFALAVGARWGTERHSSRERARFAVQARSRQAEEQAHIILQRRKDTHEDTLWSAWCEANAEATQATELLSLFFRRPSLAEEFPTLVDETESEYSDALFRKMLLEGQVAGEVGQ